MRLRLRLKFSLSLASVINVSATGATPLIMSATASGGQAGMYMWWEFAGSLTPAKNGDGSYTTTTQKDVTFVDGDSFARLDLALGYSQPSGPFAFHWRGLIDDPSGAISLTDSFGNTATYSALTAWSNDYTDSIGALAALNTTNGANKDSLLTVTGSPALSFSGSSANGNNSVRSTLQQGFTKAQFEITITSGAATGSTVVGIEDGTTNFDTTHGMPGLDGSAGVGSGIAIAFYASGSTVSIFHSAGGTEIDLTTAAGSVANADTFTIVYDKTNNTLEVHRTRSGVTTQMGSTQTGLPSVSAQYAYCGTRSSTSAGTMNFGSTAYAKTPGFGVAAFWA